MDLIKAARTALPSLTRLAACSASGLALACWAGTSQALTLEYEAYLSGVSIGTATVVVERDLSRYSIRGSARVTGAAHLFSDWRSTFYTDGRFVEGAPELVEYGYQENERRKQTVLKLRDGTLAITRNQKVRSPRPALAGMDVLTAFFIDPGCWPSRLLQTGRHSYEVEGSPSSQPGGCHFFIEDDEGDKDRVHVVFERHDGKLLPAKMTTRGLLRGSIVLKAVAQ